MNKKHLSYHHGNLKIVSPSNIRQKHFRTPKPSPLKERFWKLILLCFLASSSFYLAAVDPNVRPVFITSASSVAIKCVEQLQKSKEKDEKENKD